MNEIWETFDALYKTAHKQAKRIEELEARLRAVEERLDKIETAKVIPFKQEAA
jgi:BMFP domain-containing protein YqiC